MRNSKFMRWDVILLGLVVLRTKTRNRFCPMCTKECHTVMNRPNSFWGQFWGQNGKADSHTHRSNKCAALVSLRNMNTSITGFLPVKSPTKQYINFTLRQEVVRKHYSAALPHTAPVAARNASVWARSRCIGVVLVQPNTTLNSPLSGDFFILPQRLLPKLDFPVQVNPTQINTK